MKYLKYLVSIITAISISSVVSANEIKMAKADWDTGYFQAEIYKQGLEKLGYKVTEPKAMKPQVFYVAAAAGDLDLWVNGWFGTHDTYLKESRGKVKPVGYVMKKSGLQGYLIDKKSMEQGAFKASIAKNNHKDKKTLNETSSYYEEALVKAVTPKTTPPKPSLRTKKPFNRKKRSLFSRAIDYLKSLFGIKTKRVYRGRQFNGKRRYFQRNYFGSFQY